MLKSKALDKIMKPYAIKYTIDLCSFECPLDVVRPDQRRDEHLILDEDEIEPIAPVIDTYA